MMGGLWREKMWWDYCGGRKFDGRIVEGGNVRGGL